MSITRILVAALAVAALAAPAAQARPADLYEPIPQAQAKQEAREAINAPGATAKDSASVRGTSAVPAGQPTWPTNPKPIVTVAGEAPATGGGGLDTAPLALGIGAALLAVGGITALALRRRVQRLPA
jgi:hypothetical protein